MSRYLVVVVVVVAAVVVSLTAFDAAESSTVSTALVVGGEGLVAFTPDVMTESANGETPMAIATSFFCPAAPPEVTEY